MELVLRLSVLHVNPAQRLYTRLGFRCLAILLLVACGSGGSSPPATAPSPPPPQERTFERERERVRREQIVAAHHKIEAEQQDALAATCDQAKVTESHERCLPSCYRTEPADAPAGKKVKRPTEIPHLVCEAPGGAYVIGDEIEGNKLALRPARGRFPRAHKKGTWQATLETSLAAAMKLAKHDALVVTGKQWRDVVHPLTKERLRCVRVSHYTKSARRPLDGCTSDGTFGCEAIGNAAARGINVVHFRLAEARRLQAAGKSEDCQQAALEAVAVARGMPRWRQYAKINAGQWREYAGYRTRFDGILDEDALFATTANLGKEAEAVFAACGGPANAPTTTEQEQSFHTCW